VIVGLAARLDLEKSLATYTKQQAQDEARDQEAHDQAVRADQERLRRLRAQYIDLIDPMEKYRLKLAEVAELAAKGRLTPEQADAAAFAIEKQQNAITAVGEEAKKADTFARDLGLTFSSAFEDAVEI